MPPCSSVWKPSFGGAMRREDLRREARSFRLLRQVGPLDAVLIGGYAVSAYSPPRFSVHLGLVLGETVRNPIAAVGERARPLRGPLHRGRLGPRLRLQTLLPGGPDGGRAPAGAGPRPGL